MKRFFTFCVLGLQLAGCVPHIASRSLSEAVSGQTFSRQGEYKIGGSDELSITVFGDEKLKGIYTVSPTGVLPFPLIGFIDAAGLTTQQLTLNLEKALRPYMKSPKVTVAVASRKSYQVFFSGELSKPGAVSLDAPTTLLQGIAIAGGLTKFAAGQVYVIRLTPQATERYATSYYDLLAGVAGVDRFTLERGDVVHVE